ncbi:12569_t:CDS:2 [Entrophospora sp. SA101]|nr:12569_t:CDS:2 [Entrophospora sp. SA101]
MVTDVGMQNNMYASLLLGCYEVNQVFTLLGRKIVASVTEYSILSFKCIVELFQFTFNTLDCQVSNHAGAILRSNSGFITSKFDPEDQSTLKYCISLIQSLVITSLSERTPLIKEESELCKTIALLSSCFMFNSNESQSKGHREQLITWLRILCKERAIDNVSLTKIIVNMLVKLEREISDFDMVPEFGHDILSALGSCDTGDIDLKLDESQTPIFAIVNLRASNINCVILLEFIEQTCDEIEWPLIRMRLVISKKDFDMVPEFGHDILSALGSCDTGDIDLKLDESQTPIFAIVNLRASNINCVILLEFIEQTCDEIEWPLIRMRLVISKKGYNDEEELIDLGEFENSICKKLVILINTLIYLEQVYFNQPRLKY